MGAQESVPKAEEEESYRGKYWRKYNRLKSQLASRGPTPAEARKIGDLEQANHAKNKRLFEFLIHGPPWSGTHYIRPHKAARWIDAQPTLAKRNALRKLLDNIVYVSHGDFVSTMRSYIKKNIMLFRGNTALYMGNADAEKGSAGFVVRLAASMLWHYYEIEPPILRDDKDLVNPAYDDIVFFEDCSYTGAQCQRYVTNVVVEVYRARKHRQAEDILESPHMREYVQAAAERNYNAGLPKVHFSLVYSTDTALDRIKEYMGKAEGTWMTVEAGAVVPTTYSVLTETEVDKLGQIDMQWAEEAACVYLDFKMADYTAAYPLITSRVTGFAFKSDKGHVDRPIPDEDVSMGCVITDGDLHGTVRDIDQWQAEGPRPAPGERLPEHRDRIQMRMPAAWYRRFKWDTMEMDPSIAKIREAYSVPLPE